MLVIYFTKELPMKPCTNPSCSDQSVPDDAIFCITCGWEFGATGLTQRLPAPAATLDGFVMRYCPNCRYELHLRLAGSGAVDCPSCRWNYYNRKGTLNAGRGSPDNRSAGRGIVINGVELLPPGVSVGDLNFGDIAGRSIETHYHLPVNAPPDQALSMADALAKATLLQRLAAQQRTANSTFSKTYTTGKSAPPVSLPSGLINQGRAAVARHLRDVEGFSDEQVVNWLELVGGPMFSL